MGIHIFALLSESYILKKRLQSTVSSKFYTRLYQTSMNEEKFKVYRRVMKEVGEKYDGAEDFINNRSDEIFSHEQLSAEEVIFFFFFGFLQFSFLVRHKVEETVKVQRSVRSFVFIKLFWSIVENIFVKMYHVSINAN